LLALPGLLLYSINRRQMASHLIDLGHFNRPSAINIITGPLLVGYQGLNEEDLLAVL